VVEEHKGENIVLLDLRPDTVIADFFVLVTGNSDRQLQALAEYVREDVKTNLKEVPFSTEGTAQSGWLLMDYGEVVVHLFQDEQREYYDLEGLWNEIANVILSIQ